MIDTYILYFLLLGMALGLILMTAIYNVVLYYYNLEKPFLYYALMQLGIIVIFLYDIDVMVILFPSHILNRELGYELFSLYTLFFILMFSSSFLQLPKALPKHEKALKIIRLLIFIDVIYYPTSIIFEHYIFLFILSYVVYLGYLRVKQNYQPARFFLLGWISFLIATLSDFFLDFYVISDIIFNPMFIGSVVEAIILAIALSFHIKEIKDEKEQQKELMIHQSKLASMGEMLGNISHQWRQPLTHLSYAFMNLDILEDKQQRSKIIEEGIKRLEFMSQTIDDFKDFYAPSKKKEYFSVAKEIHKILELILDNEVKIEIEIIEECNLFNYKNEFKQVVLNIISNSQEVLLEKEVKAPKISIVIEKYSISISDNAGGIKLDNIEKIFEPYFTTKKDGLGIGLYMSKMIIEKNMGGELRVRNIRCGVEFMLIFSSSYRLKAKKNTPKNTPAVQSPLFIEVDL